MNVLILSLVLLLIPIKTWAITSGCYIVGDVDGSGVIDRKDSDLILQFTKGIIKFFPCDQYTAFKDLELIWEYPSSTGVRTFKIVWGPSSGGYTGSVLYVATSASGNYKTWLTDVLPLSKRFYFRIYAVYPDGKLSSPSNEVNVYTDK